MKKRIFSIILAVLLTLMTFPVATFAEGDGGTVAMVDNQGYSVISDAFSAASQAQGGVVVKLVKSVVNAGDTAIRVSGNITLDLNGCTLDLTGITGSSSNGGLTVETDQTLTITDSSEAGGGRIEAVSYPVVLKKGAKLVFKKGIINCKAGAKALYGIYGNANTDIIIDGGIMYLNTETPTLYAIKTDATSNVIITNGAIYTKSASSASHNFINGSGKATITGGIFTFESTKTYTGTFFGDNTKVLGGKYNFDPTNYVPVGDKIVTSNGTEKFTPFDDEQTLKYAVVTNPNPDENISNIRTGIIYSSLDQSFEEAHEGDELKLLKDIETHTTISINKGITLDMNGYDINSSIDSDTKPTLMLSGGTKENTLTITNSSQTESKITNKNEGSNTCVIMTANGQEGHYVIENITLQAEAEDKIRCIYDQSGTSTKRSSLTLNNVKASITNWNEDTTKTIGTGTYILGAKQYSDITLNNCEMTADLPNGVSSNPVCLFYIDGTNPALVINGGTYTCKSTNKTTKKADIFKYSLNAIITVNDGYFQCDAGITGTKRLASDSMKKISLNGGYYNVSPAAWKTAENEIIEITEPTGYMYHVVQSKTATTGSTSADNLEIYSSIKAAIEAVKDDPNLGEITLLKDVTISEPLSLTSKTAIDTGDYTITITSEPMVIMEDSSALPVWLNPMPKASVQVGEATHYYSTITKALYSHDSVKMLADCKGPFVISTSKTIDLNGYNIEANTDSEIPVISFSRADVPITLILTNSAIEESVISNGAVGGWGIQVVAKNYIGRPASTNTVTIGKNVTVQADDLGVFIAGPGQVLNLYGTIEAPNGIFGNGNTGNEGTTVNIYDGSRIQADLAIYNPQNGEVNLYGGEINAGTGIYMRSGKLTVPEDSTVKVEATGAQAVHGDVTGQAYKTGDAVIIDESEYPGGSPSAEIKGGAFYSENSYAIASYTSTQAPAIKGFLKGGIYGAGSNAIDINNKNLIAEGYKDIKNPNADTKVDYPWMIGAVDHNVVIVEITKDEGIEASIDDTVKIVANENDSNNVTADPGYKMNEPVTEGGKTTYTAEVLQIGQDQEKNPTGNGTTETKQTETQKDAQGVGVTDKVYAIAADVVESSGAITIIQSSAQVEAAKINQGIAAKALIAGTNLVVKNTTEEESDIAAKDISVFVDTYYQTQVTEDKTTEAVPAQQSFTLDIKPMYQAYATTIVVSDSTTMDDITPTIGTSSAAIGIPKELDMTDKIVTMKVKLPEGFVSSTSDKVYVKHTKGLTSHYYTATVVEDTEDFYAVFTNPDGFSEFTFSRESLEPAPPTPPAGGGGSSATPEKKVCPQDETCVYAKYIDADTKEWYHDGVHFCVEKGYMIGIDTDKFGPEDTLSRAMIVTMLWRMEKNPVVNYAMSFEDVASEQWYTEAVRWAQSTKIVEGYSSEAFGPEDNVTREQVATILLRYATYKGIAVSKKADLVKYTDVKAISDWALDSIKWANAVGIINGRTDTTIVPAGESSRAEAACMFQRFCETVLGTK